MSTGQYGPLNTKTWKAKRDLSSYQFHAVTLDTDGLVDYADTSAGTIPLGILQNKPSAANAEAEVALPGSVSLMVVNAGTDISQMDKLGSGNDYHGAKVTADKDLYGAIALEDATDDGDTIEVLVVGPSYISAT
ncbi:MAG: hypothetical protein UY48_C0010G0018 [Candidatus Gottesmanbacteria bacterium GW2011_GWB1_49_7]|uniref:Uncharacterized protein n=1 Tax=Candidatus Gottesmanbacteria bacterium GW2011_GWB1_49_7 TaxID=1618448 RepID=A0A0G1W1R1_9BACT|nr:MAG: hypothetical protein UY48_C0010G0018 [Candidatus Gottesmanbacteria bacterium GW2011_GWB1_49_7]